MKKVVWYKESLAKLFVLKQIKRLLKNKDIIIENDNGIIVIKKGEEIFVRIENRIENNEIDDMENSDVPVYLGNKRVPHLAKVIFSSDDDLYNNFIKLMDELIVEKEKREKSFLTKAIDWFKIKLANLI